MIKQNTAKYVAHKRSSDKQIQTSKNPLLSVAQKSSALAHVKLGINGDREIHYLEDHLRKVAKLAVNLLKTLAQTGHGLLDYGTI